MYVSLFVSIGLVFYDILALVIMGANLINFLKREGTGNRFNIMFIFN